MVKLREGQTLKSFFCRHKWVHAFYEQPYLNKPDSVRYIKICEKCGLKELFYTEDLKELPWQ